MSLLGNIPPEDLGPVRDDREIDLESLPRCPECGYIIYKVGKMRCPECGVPIQREDLVPSQARLAVEEQVRGERRVLRIGLGLLLAGAVLAYLGHRRLHPVSVCIIGPMLGSALLTVIWAAIAGNAWHRVVLCLGVVWLLAGVVLALLAYVF